jgi:hypothetical protein
MRRCITVINFGLCLRACYYEGPKKVEETGMGHVNFCRVSVVGLETGYGMDDLGVGDRVPVGSRIFSSSRRPDRLWGPLNLLSNG